MISSQKSNPQIIGFRGVSNQANSLHTNTRHSFTSEMGKKKEVSPHTHPTLRYPHIYQTLKHSTQLEDLGSSLHSSPWLLSQVVPEIDTYHQDGP